jgi:endonuclease/exonuclease/phosphatase family metal-dependent hydrolase
MFSSLHFLLRSRACWFVGAHRFGASWRRDHRSHGAASRCGWLAVVPTVMATMVGAAAADQAATTPPTTSEVLQQLDQFSAVDAAPAGELRDNRAGVGNREITNVRLVTYNVHLWLDGHCKSSGAAISAVIQELDADVVCLQETAFRTAPAVAVLCGMPNAVVTEENGSGTNAIASRHPIECLETLRMVVASANADDDTAEVRLATYAEIRLPCGRRLHVVNTHLTDGLESDRVEQARSIVAWLRRFPPGCIVVGDLNAVRLDDYRPEDREMIDGLRQEAGLAALQGDAVDVLDQAGYRDAYRLHRLRRRRRRATGAGVDRDAKNNNDDEVPNDEDDDAEVPPSWQALHTSCYRVRIDYVWLARDAPWHVTGYAVHRQDPEQASEPSDHYPVVVDLIPAS